MRENQLGLSLIELIFVIVLIAIISSFALQRVESISAWKYESDIRTFANLIQLLNQESKSQNQSYRLVINLEENSYFVRREVQLRAGEVRQVDYLENLRTKGEKERRRRREEEQLKSLEDEFKEEDIRKSESLVQLYYANVFSDPEADVRLGIPLEFPSLAEKKQLSNGLRFKSVVIDGTAITNDQTYVKFASNKEAPNVLLHFEIEQEATYSLYISPSTKDVKIVAKELDYEDVFDEEE